MQSSQQVKEVVVGAAAALTERERERERERESEEGQTVQSVLIEKQQRKKRKEFAASVGKFGRGSRSTI